MASSQWDAPLVVKRDWTVLGGTLNNFKQKPGAVLRRFCLDRHENSKGHQAASKSQPTDSALHLAPSQESFEEFLTQALQGQSVRDGGVTSDKRIKMRWALTEAILARNRKLLADSQSMTLLRDERKGKLLVRFRAVLRDLSTVSGCFGLLPVSGSADSIASATDTLMEAYCTPMRQPPRASCVTESSVDQALLQHLRQTVTIIVTDAAASEQIATDLQRGRREFADESGQGTMKNVRIVGQHTAPPAALPGMLRAEVCHARVVPRL